MECLNASKDLGSRVRSKGLSRFRKPKKISDFPPRKVAYRHAEAFAKDVTLPERGQRVFCLLGGRFEFGDLIEAMMVGENAHVKKMAVSTLSMSKNNVDSLQNLLDGGYVDDMHLMLSDYAYNADKWTLVPHILQTLDVDNRFQLYVVRTHIKFVLLEMHDGRKIVFHGSANLRSSGNLEQMIVEESPELFDFDMEVVDSIGEQYQVIRKSAPEGAAWKKIMQDKADRVLAKTLAKTLAKKGRKKV